MARDDGDSGNFIARTAAREAIETTAVAAHAAFDDGTVEFKDEDRARAVMMRDGVADEDDNENDECENDNAQKQSRESFEHADLVRPGDGTRGCGRR